MIGSGPGGQRAAIQAAKLGKKVAVAARLPFWKAKGMLLGFLTSYGPELNLMELEWRDLKAQLQHAVRQLWGQAA